jgi:hypothetical protein
MPTLIDYLLASNWYFAAMTDKDAARAMVVGYLEAGLVLLVVGGYETTPIPVNYVLKEADNLYFPCNGHQEEFTMEYYEQCLRYING